MEDNISGKVWETWKQRWKYDLGNENHKYADQTFKEWWTIIKADYSSDDGFVKHMNKLIGEIDNEK